MKFMKIPTTDVEVSKICLGSMNWGEKNTEEDAYEQLDYAVKEREINFIDTAEMYPIPPHAQSQGRTETYIGNWVKKNKNRNVLIIASKVAGRAGIDWIRKGDATPTLSREHIFEAIEGSLERLQTDYIDIYQLHWPDRNTNYFGKRGVLEIDDANDVVDLRESLEALGELVKQGKIRYAGLSNETPWGIMKFLELAKELNLPRVVTLQNSYNLINRTLEVGISEVLLRENVGLLAYSPLAYGVLSGKYLDGKIPADSRFAYNKRNYERFNTEAAQPAVKAYVELAKDHGLDPSQMALAFVNQQEFLTANIIGASNLKQLKDDIDTIDMELNDEVLQGIDEIYRKYPDPAC